MPEHPLKVIMEKDPKLFSLLGTTHDLAFSEGGIPMKYKLLIAMSLDAANGAVDGVKFLAIQAMQAGATKEEVMEAIRVTQYISGAGSVYTAASALNDVL